MKKDIALKLETDYKVYGNSSGQQIDTLAIAVDGRDFNDIYECNYDYRCSVEDEAIKDWLKSSECEDTFVATLTKEQAQHFQSHIDEYDKALEEYRDDLRAKSIDDLPYEHPMAVEVQKWVDRELDDMYKEWLYGDYHGNFAGIIPQTRKYLADYCEDVDYDKKKDVITVTLCDDAADRLKEEGYIECKTKKEVQHAIEVMIESKARGQYTKRQRENAERAERYKKEREYKEKQAIEYKAEKEKRILEKLQKVV